MTADLPPEAITAELDVPGHGTIHNAVRADIDAREAQGDREYGKPHRLRNGLDGLAEAYEEALDMAFWLRQEIEERKLDEAAIRASERERVATEIEAEAAGHLFSVRRAMRWAVWVVRGKPEGDGPAADMLGRDAATSPCCPVETAARADERIRIAASLRSMPVAEFLARHGLQLGDGGRPVLCAIAAEIEGPGGSGCGRHPGQQEARDG